MFEVAQKWERGREQQTGENVNIFTHSKVESTVNLLTFFESLRSSSQDITLHVNDGAKRQHCRGFVDRVGRGGGRRRRCRRLKNIFICCAQENSLSTPEKAKAVCISLRWCFSLLHLIPAILIMSLTCEINEASRAYTSSMSFCCRCCCLFTLNKTLLQLSTIFLSCCFFFSEHETTFLDFFSSFSWCDTS